jgi:hypothetical protein
MNKKELKKLADENKLFLDALKEYDKTGKVPELPKQRVNFTIDPVKFNKFRKYCKNNHISMSGLIEDYIESFINKKQKI